MILKCKYPLSFVLNEEKVIAKFFLEEIAGGADVILPGAVKWTRNVIPAVMENLESHEDFQNLKNCTIWTN